MATRDVSGTASQAYADAQGSLDGCTAVLLRLNAASPADVDCEILRICSDSCKPGMHPALASGPSSVSLSSPGTAPLT